MYLKKIDADRTRFAHVYYLFLLTDKNILVLWFIYIYLISTIIQTSHDFKSSIRKVDYYVSYLRELWDNSQSFWYFLW